jgi:hypothetical protein
MRRFAFTLAATGLLLVFAPAGALAHHHRGHHNVKARHSRVRKFGDLSGSPSSSTTTPSSGIGTVQSFTGGVLTILLSDQSTVSGAVTNDTAIKCASSSSSHESDDQSDQSSGSSDQGEHGDQTSGSSDEQGDQSSSDDDHGDQSSSSGDDDQSEGQSGSSSSCSSASLTPGAAISGAELKISGAGKTWEKIDLS